MRKRLIAGLFSAVLLSILVVVPANASKPTAFSGTFTNTWSDITGIREAGGNIFIDRSYNWDIAGDFVGTSVAHLTLISHPNGKVTFTGTETFTGTLGGHTGTFVVRQSGSSSDGINFQGRFVILSGTGGLINLHGQGTFQATSASGTYSAEYHFH